MNQILLPVGTALMFAVTFLLRKKSTGLIPIQTAYLIETIVQLVLISLIFFFLSPDIKKGLDLKFDGVKFAIISGFSVVIAVCLNYAALKSGTYSKVIAITPTSQIIFGALIGVLLTGDTLTIKQIIGTILGIIGVLLII